MANPNWKKGVSGNPNGRPAIITPEVRKLVDRDRNNFKLLVSELLNMDQDEFEDIGRRKMSIGRLALYKCMERIINEGDIFRLRALLEIVFGKIPEDTSAPEFTAQEMRIIEMFRERLAAQNAQSGITDSS